MATKFVTSSYHFPTLQIEQRVKTLQRVVRIYDANPKFRELPLVVTGISGMAIGVPLAFQLNLEFCVVRKKGDSDNASHRIEGYIPIGEFLILDDLVSSGNTIKRITDAIKGVSPDARCIGIILYNDPGRYNHGVMDIPVYNDRVSDDITF